MRKKLLSGLLTLSLLLTLFPGGASAAEWDGAQEGADGVRRTYDAGLSKGGKAPPLLSTDYEMPAFPEPASVKIFRDGEPVEDDSVPAGGTVMYTAKVYDKSGEEISGQGVVWELHDAPAGVEIISGALKIGAGTPAGTVFQVIATADVSIPPMPYTEITIKVLDMPQHHLSVTPKELCVQTGGGYAQIKAESQTGGKITYRSEDSTIAAVTQNGTVTGLHAGETQILVTAAADEAHSGAEEGVLVTVAPHELSAASVVLEKTSYTYTGTPIEPAVTVDGKSLAAAKCTAVYSENVNAGQAYVTVVADIGSDYKGATDRTFAIEKAALVLSELLEPLTLTANAGENDSGEALTRFVQESQETVSVSGQEIPIVWEHTGPAFCRTGADYTFTGRPALTEEQARNYDCAGTLTREVKVLPVTVEAVTAAPGTVTVTKEALAKAVSLEDIQIPKTVSVKYDLLPLPFSVDAEWDKGIEDLRAAAEDLGTTGQASVTLAVKKADFPAWATSSGLASTPKVEVIITAKEAAAVEIGNANSIGGVYGGPFTAPEIKVTAGPLLAEDGLACTYTGTSRDGGAYGPSGLPPVNAGSYTVTAVYEDGEYFGASSASFTILPKTIQAGMVSSISDAVYSGGEITPAVTVTDGTALEAGRDYTITWENNVNAASAESAEAPTVTITGRGNYTGAASKAFTIAPKALTGSMAAVFGVYTYTGKPITPALTIQDGGRTLSAPGDYEAVFENNLHATSPDSKASITITGKGNYTGTISKTFEIAPAPLTGIVTISAGDSQIITEILALKAELSRLAPEGARTDMAFQWYMDGAAIEGETGQQYAIKPEDTAGGAAPSFTVRVKVSGDCIGETESPPVTVGKKPVPSPTGGLTLTAERTESGRIILTAAVFFEDMTAAEFNENFYIQWYRNGKPVGGKEKISTGRARSVQTGAAVYPVTAEDAGAVITCMILPEPSSGYTGQLTASSVSSPVGGGQLDGAGGFIAPSATVPDAPGNVTAAVSGGEITVSWTAPVHDGGAEIEKYIVTLADGQGGTESKESADTFSCAFTKEPGVYTVTVTAMNREGSSAPSISVTVTVSEQQPAPLPSPPVISGGDFVSSGSGGGSSTRRHSASSVPAVSMAAVSASAGGSVSISPKSPGRGKTAALTVHPDSGFILSSLKVLDAQGGEILLTRTSENGYTFVMPSGRVRIEPVFIASGEPSSVGFPFADAEASWAREAIAWAWERGYVNGVSASAFDPDGGVTRRQVWMILARLSGEAPPDMARASAWAVENGLTDGTAPAAPVTRQQLAAFLYRFAAARGEDLGGPGDLSAFPDSGAASPYAREALAWAAGRGVLTGTSAGTLDPGGGATRAQFAAVLQRFCQNALGD